MHPAPEDQLAPVVAAAEQLLSTRFGRTVRLGEVVQISDEGRRNVLLRCRDITGGSPATVIIKKVVTATYNPEDTTSWDIKRFFSDWVGAEFLSAIPRGPHCPEFFGGDYALGFFILEDLGDHRSLVEPLVDGDAAAAETALLEFSACLGALHASTIGESARFERLFATISPHITALAKPERVLDERVRKLQAALDGLGVRTDIGFDQDVETVSRTIDEPGPFFSYVHGDACPDNLFWTGEHLRLIDFEFGSFGHALVDGVYGRMMFPTCWCANRIPSPVVSRMENVYRTELVEGCPQAEDDRIFEIELARVCGFWLLNTLGRELERAEPTDRTWGIGTMRQRVLARLDTFNTAAEQCNQLPALRSMAGRLSDSLRNTWPDTVPLPFYPAFQKSSETA
jgi:hypothetical protein